jgi:hypothetical protein
VYEGATFGYVFRALMPLAPTTFANTSASATNAYESQAALNNEQKINRELAAGGNAQLTPAEEADVFGPSNEFNQMTPEDKERCSKDATCFNTNPPQP